MPAPAASASAASAGPTLSAAAPPAASASAAPIASASSAGPKEPPPPDLPLPPAKREVPGDAAIAWLPDPKAPDGVRSVLVERDGGTVSVTAEHAGPLFVGRRDVWRVERRDVKLGAVRCNEITQCSNDRVLSEPRLKSLDGTRSLPLPWASDFAREPVCDRTVGLQFDGVVGSVGFARVWRSDLSCGAACATHGESLYTFDVDTGKSVRVEFPKTVEAPLREHARAVLGDFLTEPCVELPAYRATGAYRADGTLVGRYEYGDNHAGLCGTAPHCPNSVETSDWIPSALEPWGKLPAWVGEFLAARSGEHAVMLEASRVPGLRRALRRK